MPYPVKGIEDGDGNFCVVDERAERRWLPERHAPAIRSMLGRHGLEIRSLARFVARADVFGKQSDGSSVASQYARLGIRLTAANMERVQRWSEILRRLGDVDAGIRPSLFIHERCARLIECLPNLQHDPNRPEDVLKVDCDDDGNGGDDAADAFRYLVQSTGRTVRQVKLRGV